MIYLRGQRYWYRFSFDGQRIQKTTRQSSRIVAMQMEARHRSALVEARHARAVAEGVEEFKQNRGRGWGCSPRSAPKTEHVYLLETEHGYHKIGVARDVERRAREIQSGMPFKVKVVHSFRSANAREAEFALHMRFNAKRRSGEWFELSPDDVAYVKQQDGQRHEALLREAEREFALTRR
jgi:hypothetical protein